MLASPRVIYSGNARSEVSRRALRSYVDVVALSYCLDAKKFEVDTLDDGRHVACFFLSSDCEECDWTLLLSTSHNRSEVVLRIMSSDELMVSYVIGMA